MLKGLDGMFFSLAQGVLVITLLSVLFVLRGLGAGDIKLYGVIGIYKGFKFSIVVFAAGIIICALNIIIGIITGRIKPGDRIRMMPSTAAAYMIIIVFKGGVV